MAPSRKRRCGASARSRHEEPARKKVKLAPGGNKPSAPEKTTHAVLSRYYPRILTLRNWILFKLPEASKIRRRKLAAIGTTSAKCKGSVSAADAEHLAGSPSDATPDEAIRSKLPEASKIRRTVADAERLVGSLLDTTLVGVTGETKSIPDDRWEQWASFSQRGDESYVTLSDGLAGSSFSQSEIVDFVVWLLFSKAGTGGAWPGHLLCDGFRRRPESRFQTSAANSAGSIPGIYSVHVNQNYNTLKSTPWPELLKLLGKSGDRIMMDLLLDCSVFISVNAGQDNYCQVSGYPLNEAELLQDKHHPKKQKQDSQRSPSDITFVRSRMLYARAALNARGSMYFGLRHIHILNRAPYIQPPSSGSGARPSGGSSGDLTARNEANTVKVIMYMFPRQFGLHNAFTSKVDYKETTQKFKDYTLREEEIIEKFGGKGGDSQPCKTHLPKRLRGKTKELVVKLQILHMRCSYSKLLEHYCPAHASPGSKGASQDSCDRSNRSSKGPRSSRTNNGSQVQPTLIQLEVSEPQSLVDLATPTSQVSAFCQSVVSNIVPNEFLGAGSVQEQNKGMLLKKIDQFIRLRRFEAMSLHEVMQGMKITELEWLAPSKLMGQKTSQTDIRKRVELFYELLYYIFDSILIPLIRSSFYVTESNTHKYQLFFFRHDVWRSLSEPAVSALKAKMFEEVRLGDANRILGSRDLGFSQVRLLPKKTGIRPIMNLRRRQAARGNAKVLGPSINTILGPVHNMLQLERTLNLGKLGSTLFCPADLYDRVKSFKSTIKDHTKPFYFAKLDVQAAFDTIPQAAIVGLLGSIPQRAKYLISRHVEITNNQLDSGQVTSFKPTRKWHSTATHTTNSNALFQSLRLKKAAKMRNTIFVDNVFKRERQTNEMLQLVASHIQQNLVKIGKKYYRQKQGIPQGSVLSSTLCNYFYADLEMQVLGFLNSEDCLLLRLIDDFLLITTDKSKAIRFVQALHRGVPEYGVTVSPNKTLVNFDLTINGTLIAKTPPGQGFPYCGTNINSKTLDITKNREGTTDHTIYNSLTVNFDRTPGQNFERKVINAFKIQSHMMFYDTSHNGSTTALVNLHAAFTETATKMWAYARCLPRPKQPAASLVVRTVAKLADMAYLLLTSKMRRLRHPGYVCDVRKSEVTWLAYRAFHGVLRKKQAGYGSVLEWLEGDMGRLEGKKEIRLGRIRGIAV